ncbi:MAG: hypothetical protein CM15mP106_7130 [Candidatus Neomarinimicrobiota bacterium]|nr:MAG: hypothetical protein CM15mP106_7130 [Candidatus Neomarinimicrobiota bacterium]
MLHVSDVSFDHCFLSECAFWFHFNLLSDRRQLFTVFLDPLFYLHGPWMVFRQSEDIWVDVFVCGWVRFSTFLVAVSKRSAAAALRLFLPSLAFSFYYNFGWFSVGHGRLPCITMYINNTEEHIIRVLY